MQQQLTLGEIPLDALALLVDVALVGSLLRFARLALLLRLSDLLVDPLRLLLDLCAAVRRPVSLTLTQTDRECPYHRGADSDSGSVCRAS